MSDIFTALNDGLVCRLNRETLFIQAWGAGLRVRATMASSFRDDALSALLPVEPVNATVSVENGSACVTNGDLRCEVVVAFPHGEPRKELQLRFVEVSTGQEVLTEQRAHFQWPGPRFYKSLAHQCWRVETTFSPAPGERLYGMGQRQHGLLDQKGCVLELLQRNGEVNIPWVISSRGYGFLWNTPAVGRAEFGQTLTRWVAEAAHQIDYWVTVGSPAELLDRYADVTGRSPAFPAWASGFWQSKLRYHNQEQVLTVAREHRRRGLPLDCIVIDFFHWTRQGEWRFDLAHWPDPAAMVAELRSLGIEVMVSIWPTVNPNAQTWEQMDQEGWLVESDRGLPLLKPFIDTDTGPQKMVPMHFYDPTHPGARAFVFEQVRSNYLSLGIKGFWLDACEPAIMPVHPESLRLHLGSGTEVINAYPLFHTQAFSEGLKHAGEPAGMLLCRSAWAGSQRYGCLLWSGDIRSTFDSFRAQICAGLNAGLSGIGWWTTDIGGFYDGNGNDPCFRELLVRWFQWAVFCPVTRLHGYRVNNDVAQREVDPAKPYGEDQELDPNITGGDNEVWSWGEEVYDILRHCLSTRERLRPYVMRLMAEFSATGAPPLRPLFFDFPDEIAVWSVDDQHMFGPDLLVAPVLEFGARSRSVLLPSGSRWTDVWTGNSFEGGQRVEVGAPLERMPVFARDEASVLSLIE